MQQLSTTRMNEGDEREIRELIDGLSESWARGDAAAYASALPRTVTTSGSTGRGSAVPPSLART